MKKNCRRSLNWTEFAALLFHIIIVYLKPQGLFNHTEHKACTSYSNGLSICKVCLLWEKIKKNKWKWARVFKISLFQNKILVVSKKVFFLFFIFYNYGKVV